MGRRATCRRGHAVNFPEGARVLVTLPDGTSLPALVVWCRVIGQPACGFQFAAPLPLPGMQGISPWVIAVFVDRNGAYREFVTGTAVNITLDAAEAL